MEQGVSQLDISLFFLIVFIPKLLEGAGFSKRRSDYILGIKRSTGFLAFGLKFTD